MAKTALIVVQCRYGSTRLPGKALYPLAGLPMIAFLLRRLHEGLNGLDCRLTVATTTGREDDVVAAWGDAERADVVRGHPTDLVSRFSACLGQFPADYAVRVTADNPFTCPVYLAWTIRMAFETSSDYVQPLKLPCGAGVDVFSSAAIARIAASATADDEREHLNLHILRNKGSFKTLFPEVSGPCARPEVRLTVDTHEDWLQAARLCAGAPEIVSPWSTPLQELISYADNLQQQC